MLPYFSFHTTFHFFVQSNFLLNSLWLATFFKVKKVGSNPTFYCFRTTKVGLYEKIRKWKTSFNIKYVNKNFANIHCIPHLTLQLWNDAEQILNCKWLNEGEIGYFINCDNRKTCTHPWSTSNIWDSWKLQISGLPVITILLDLKNNE